MMKKFLVLGVVLALSSSAMAGLVGLEIVDPQPGYLPSTTIIIQVKASEGWQDFPYDSIGFMDITSMQSDGGGLDGFGTASNPSLNSALAVGTGGSSSAGDIVNSGGILIQDIRGYIEQPDETGVDFVEPFGSAILYSFEFHIPDLPYSTYIIITMDGLVLNNLGYNPPVPGYTATSTLEIHVIPEPMTIALLGLGGLFLRRRR